MRLFRAYVRKRGKVRWKCVAEMRITDKTTTRDYVIFRGQVRTSFMGPYQFQFLEFDL